MGPCTMAESEAEANGIASVHSAGKVSLVTPITPAVLVGTQTLSLL